MIECLNRNQYSHGQGRPDVPTPDFSPRYGREQNVLVSRRVFFLLAGAGTAAVIASPTVLPILNALTAASLAAKPNTVQELSDSQERAVNPTPDPLKDPNKKPPPKDYCGENMPSFFAYLFWNESLQRFMKPTNILTVDSLPLFQGEKEIMAKYEIVGKSLRDKGCYFYPGGGSVFSDYKRIRDAHFPEKALTQWVSENINTNMSSQQAFDIVKSLVDTWW
jgi:hypothetical protein